jgi:hypothetical protein
MERITLNSVINKEKRYYGLKLLGIVCGAVCGLMAWTVFNMTVGIIGIVIGYFFGVWFSGLIHSGRLQKEVYWKLPSKLIFSNKYLPPSHIRRFM